VVALGLGCRMLNMRVRSRCIPVVLGHHLLQKTKTLRRHFVDTLVLRNGTQ
jgi:hypothetical protein